jgi:hydrophobe/amphiphile efflux-1 (HAE1) family protein
MSGDPLTEKSDLPSISVRRPVLAIVMNLLIVVAGISAFLGVEVRELPNVDKPIVTIRYDFPGASPATIDADVTRVLEGAVARVPGVRQITSASEEANGRIRLEFEPNVDISNAANDVREAVNGARRRLPDGVENIVVVKADDNDDPIIRLAVSSPRLGRSELTKVIEDQIVPALQRVPGVADVPIFGNRERTLNIVVDPARLTSYQIGIDQIAKALRSARLDVPAGSMDSAEQKLLVRADASVVKEAAVERIVIKGNVRIGDVASVFYAPAEALSYVRLNGRRVISIGVVRQAKANTIDIADKVYAEVARLNRNLHDVEIVKTSDESIYIRGAISEVVLALVLGVAIVILVMVAFLGSWSMALIPAVTIPVSLIGTLAAIWLMGFSINILTLLALVLATGLVVDDAIVVLENIERKRREGTEPLAAAVLGTRQVFFAVMATTITLISVFIPIAFLPGQAGRLFTEFGFTLAIAVAISSFAALSICPMLSSRLAVDTGAKKGPIGRAGAAIMAPFEYLGRQLATLYDVLLERAMRIPLLFVGVCLIGAAMVGTLFYSLKQELVPREDRGMLIITMQGPDGTNLDYTDRQAVRAEKLLEEAVRRRETDTIMSIIGRYDLNRAFIIVPLSPWGTRRSQHEIAASLRQGLNAIPGARSRIRSPNSLRIRSRGAQLEFAVTGPDYDTILAAGDKLIGAIERELPGLTGARLDYQNTQPQLALKIDRERAADLGIDVEGIAAVLKAVVEGTEITEINVGDQAVPVRLQTTAGTVDDTDDLRNLYVTARNGRMVPLSAIITVNESGIAAELDRHGQRRAIDVDADLTPGTSMKQAIHDLEVLAAKTLPPGTGLVFLGQARTLKETSSGLAITFIVALLVVFLVLAAQFESFMSAAVVMVTVPFGLATAGFALWLSGTSINIYSQIGLVMLVGLMAKNGILIVEFANQLRDQGRSVEEAAREASRVRLRPVVMTMLSTTLAAVPLVFSTGAGAEARNAIGWVVFGGLGIAILATLFITPVVFRLLAPYARSRGDRQKTLVRQLRNAPETRTSESGGSAQPAE